MVPRVWPSRPDLTWIWWISNPAQELGEYFLLCSQKDFMIDTSLSCWHATLETLQFRRRAVRESCSSHQHLGTLNKRWSAVSFKESYDFQVQGAMIRQLHQCVKGNLLFSWRGGHGASFWLKCTQEQYGAQVLFNVFFSFCNQRDQQAAGSHLTWPILGQLLMHGLTSFFFYQCYDSFSLWKLIFQVHNVKGNL